MKRLVFAVAVTLLLTWPSLAQTSTDDSPATKEDVQRYFQIVKSHDLMKKVMASMAQGIQQMTHEQYVKHQNELSAGYEAKTVSYTHLDVYKRQRQNRITRRVALNFRRTKIRRIMGNASYEELDFRVDRPHKPGNRLDAIIPHK